MIKLFYLSTELFISSSPNKTYGNGRKIWFQTDTQRRTGKNNDQI